MVRSVVRRAGDGRWLTRPRPRAVHRYPLTCIVVTVAEGPQCVSAEFVGQAGQAGGRVIGVFRHDPVRQRMAGPPACVVVGEADDRRSLRDGPELVGVVVGIADLALARDVPCAAAAGRESTRSMLL